MSLRRTSPRLSTPSVPFPHGNILTKPAAAPPLLPPPTKPPTFQTFFLPIFNTARGGKPPFPPKKTDSHYGISLLRDLHHPLARQDPLRMHRRVQQVGRPAQRQRRVPPPVRPQLRARGRRKRREVREADEGGGGGGGLEGRVRRVGVAGVKCVCVCVYTCLVLY